MHAGFFCWFEVGCMLASGHLYLGKLELIGSVLLGKHFDTSETILR